MPEPQQTEENPYIAPHVADIAETVGVRKTPGPVAIIFAILLGATTAIVTFCATFFMTCVGLMEQAAILGDSAIPMSTFAGVVTSIGVTWFAVWGFLKIVTALKS